MFNSKIFMNTNLLFFRINSLFKELVLLYLISFKILTSLLFKLKKVTYWVTFFCFYTFWMRSLRQRADKYPERVEGSPRSPNFIL